MPKTPRKVDSEVVIVKDVKKIKKGSEQDSSPPAVMKPKDLFKVSHPIGFRFSLFLTNCHLSIIECNGI